MEIKEKEYRYAEKTEQIKKANSFLTLGYLCFYSAMLFVVWIATIRGVRTLAYSLILTVIVVISLAVTSIMERKKPGNEHTKYVHICEWTSTQNVCILYLYKKGGQQNGLYSK